MTITRRKAGLAGIAALGASALLLAGCAPAPEASSTPTGPAAPADFLACVVSDTATAGFNDKSFNQLSLKGIQDAVAELGIPDAEKHLTSRTADDYAPNIDSLASEGCDVIVGTGFLLSAAILAAADKYPDIAFANVDDGLDAEGATGTDGKPTGDGKPDKTNGKPIQFDTVQAAFLGGYIAASYSKTGIVGTYGGIPIPPVTIFMDGFVEGVNYYNEQKGTNVQVVGWDVEKQTGVFTMGFAADAGSKDVAKGILDQGADVLFPVGGPIYQTAAAAIRDKGGDIALLGVDADVYETDPTVKDLLLTSVLKGVDAAVKQVVLDVAAGNFSNAAFIGTLENGSLGVAPFHDFASKVDPGLQAEVDKLKADIISGAVKPTSVSSPK